MTISFLSVESPSPIWTAFSIYTNGKKLLQSTRPSHGSEQILCFNGMKFISMWWIISGHGAISWFLAPVMNKEYRLNVSIYPSYYQASSEEELLERMKWYDCSIFITVAIIKIFTIYNNRSYISRYILLYIRILDGVSIFQATNQQNTDFTASQSGSVIDFASLFKVCIDFIIFTS